MDDRFEAHLAERTANPRASTRKWHPDHDRLGLVGEEILCRHFGAPQDLRNKPDGDRGIDLQIFVATTAIDGWLNLDAKATTAWPCRLIVGCDKCYADVVYVLVHIADLEQHDGLCLGWRSGHELRALAPQFIRGEWTFAAELPLHSMLELTETFAAWRHCDRGVQSPR